MNLDEVKAFREMNEEQRNDYRFTATNDLQEYFANPPYYYFLQAIPSFGLLFLLLTRDRWALPEQRLLQGVFILLCVALAFVLLIRSTTIAAVAAFFVLAAIWLPDRRVFLVGPAMFGTLVVTGSARATARGAGAAGASAPAVNSRGRSACARRWRIGHGRRAGQRVARARGGMFSGWLGSAAMPRSRRLGLGWRVQGRGSAGAGRHRAPVCQPARAGEAV